jgi:hypothetical protein
MHPIELMRKYGWSYQKLAEEFGVSEVEARRWGFRKTASNYRNPPQMAYKLAQRIDKELSSISASEYSSDKTIFRTIAT